MNSLRSFLSYHGFFVELGLIERDFPSSSFSDFQNISFGSPRFVLFFLLRCIYREVTRLVNEPPTTMSRPEVVTVNISPPPQD